MKMPVSLIHIMYSCSAAPCNLVSACRCFGWISYSNFRFNLEDI